MSRTLSRVKREAGISLKMPQWKRASASFEGKISWFFSCCGKVPLELPRGPQEPTRGTSGRFSLHASHEGPLGIPLQSLPGPRSSSAVEAGTSGFLSRDDMNLGVPLGRPQVCQGLVSCEAMQVRSPLEPIKQCQASCRVDHRDRWLSIEVPHGCHSCHRVLIYWGDR